MHQGKSNGGPEANGSDGSSFDTSLTVFSIPTPATGAREAIGSKLPGFRTRVWLQIYLVGYRCFSLEIERTRATQGAP
jgi:hypothetical protein